MLDKVTVVVGKRIRAIRKSRNISQENLAENCGLHPTYIGQIERGEKCPTIDSLNKISEGLNISLSELFGNMENKKANDSLNYADKIYDEVLSLPTEKQKELYEIISMILKF